jgi:hypothetical protein
MIDKHFSLHYLELPGNTMLKAPQVKEKTTKADGFRRNFWN